MQGNVQVQPGQAVGSVFTVDIACQYKAGVDAGMHADGTPGFPGNSRIHPIDGFMNLQGRMNRSYRVIFMGPGDTECRHHVGESENLQLKERL